MDVGQNRFGVGPGCAGMGSGDVGTRFVGLAGVGQHVIVETNEERTELTFLLVANLGQDEVEIRLAEVSWELLDGLDVGVGRNLTTAGVLGWGDSEKGTGVIADDLDHGALVRVTVTLANHLKDSDANPGALGNQVANGDGLETIRTFVTSVAIEGTKLGPDLLGQRSRMKLDIVTHRGIGSGPGGVGDEVDGDVATHEIAKVGSHVLLGLVLPLPG